MLNKYKNKFAMIIMNVMRKTPIEELETLDIHDKNDTHEILNIQTGAFFISEDVQFYHSSGVGIIEICGKAVGDIIEDISNTQDIKDQESLRKDAVKLFASLVYEYIVNPNEFIDRYSDAYRIQKIFDYIS